MGKLVVFKLGHGSFEQGFPVTLQIGDDGSRPSLEVTGKLPPAPEIRLYSSRWTTAYRRLGARYRLEAKAGVVTNVSTIENCYNAAQLLCDANNTWLQSESFRSVRDKFLEQLLPTDEVRVIIQTEDIGLQRLPWHLWDLCERYPKAEIVLSAPGYEQVKQTFSPKTKVRILAILGNSYGINTRADRLLLEQLPDAEVSFLVEPECQELTEKLSMQGGDILFFAGHSSSQADGETGRIYINQSDSLTIDQLKYGLKKAVERGLKIAIFNSCDGLGLARNLADLQIPQIIVMREPVPDRVAQEFLKSFLEAFASGESFYLSVREARERLQGLEDQFPCATWLPIICQNPAEVPPTWQGLRGEIKPDSPPDDEPVKPISKGCLRAVFLASVVITSIIMGVRHLGMLQPLELQAFDQTARQRPDEKRDPRLLVVTVTDKDLQLPEQKQRKGSLSDLALNRLLEKLEQYQPRAIGLDIYREDPVDPKYPNLATRLRRNERFIAVCKVTDPEYDPSGYQPPPEVPIERLGFSDFVVDPDHIVRRQLLSLTPDPASPCTTSYAFSVQLAFRYLAAQGILPKYTPDGFLQLGNVVFKPLEAHTGGYQGVDAAGYQVLLNYRSPRSPQNIAAQVTLTDILTGQINPNSVKDRIVLIGTTDTKFKDYWFTPYSNGLWPDQPGVLVQAQMVSQIISAVLDHRPLLWVLPFGGEIIWVWGWSLIGATLAWRLRSPLKLGLAVGVTLGCLYGFCFIILVQSGCWVPLVGAALAVVATSSSVAAYMKSQARYNKTLFQSLKGT